MRDKLINNILLQMGDCLDTYQLQKLRTVLTINLNDYDLTPHKLELTTFVHNDEDIIKLFLVNKKIEGCADRTIQLYGNTLKANLHLYIKKSCLEFTKDDLRIHFAKRMIDNPQLSKVYLNIERRVFSSFFSWLFINEYIPKNPMLAIKKIKEDKVIKEAFKEEEVERMRECLNAREVLAYKKSKTQQIIALRDSAIFEFLLSTGCRVNEVSTAKLSNLDLYNREIKVLGKGSKERICYLNTKSVIKLQNYLEARGKDKNPWLFASYSHGAGQHDNIQTSKIEVLVRNLGRECGIDKCHPHRFRRTCATWALNKGMPLEEVQEMLGHDNIETTTIYAKTNKKNVKASHEKYM